jgi:hypothetical protein
VHCSRVVTALIFQAFFLDSISSATQRAPNARQKLPGKSVRDTTRLRFNASKSMSSTERKNPCHRKNH